MIAQPSGFTDDRLDRFCQQETDAVRNGKILLERDQRGRFVTGGTGGPGRPKRRTEASYLRAIRDVVSLDDFMEITKRAVVDAKGGDGKARDWLSRYLLDGENNSLSAIAVREIKQDVQQRDDDDWLVQEAISHHYREVICALHRDEFHRHVEDLYYTQFVTA